MISKAHSGYGMNAAPLDDEDDYVYAEEFVVEETDAVDDATTIEEPELEEVDKVAEERKAYELFKKTGIVTAKKGGTGKSYLEEMDEGNEAGYDAETRRDGLKYFHRVGHTTAETTDIPLVIPPTEEDVEDLMLLDALRASMGITKELDTPMFRNIKVKLQSVRRSGLDDSVIFDNPAEISTLEEYYGFLDSSGTSWAETTPQLLNTVYEDEDEDYAMDYDREEETEDEYYEIGDEQENFLFDGRHEVYFGEQVEHEYFRPEHNVTVYNAAPPEDEDYEVTETTENFVTIARSQREPEEEYFEDDKGNLRLRKKPKRKEVLLRPPIPRRNVCTIAEMLNRLVGMPLAATAEPILPHRCNNCSVGCMCCGICTITRPQIDESGKDYDNADWLGYPSSAYESSAGDSSRSSTSESGAKSHTGGTVFPRPRVMSSRRVQVISNTGTPVSEAPSDRSSSSIAHKDETNANTMANRRLSGGGTVDDMSSGMSSENMRAGGQRARRRSRPTWTLGTP